METPAPDSPAAEHVADAQPYEFGKQPELDDSAVREVRLLFDKFGESLAEMWAEDMRTSPDIEVGDVTQVSADSLAEWVQDGSDVTLASIPPLLGPAALVIPPDLALNMIDLLLGGTGQWKTPARPLTGIEATMLSSASRRMLAVLGESLAGPGSRPRISANSRKLDDLSLETSLGDIIAVELKLTHLNREMSLHVGLSMDLSAALVSELAESLDNLVDSPSRDVLARTVVGIDIGLSVEFPPVQVRSAELLQLSPGDMLDLDCRTDEPLLLTSSGSTLAAVRPARNGENLAVQIVAFPYDASSRTRTTSSAQDLNLGAL